ncbi:MAG: ornithine cyclodeaminase family protein [Actinobacteria bacterium]|nr:ornithine cyclodeaminase family protein [Actinomycetota bacterium]
MFGPDQVREAVPMNVAITAVRDAFVGLGAGEFEMPVRNALDEGRFLTMSAYHRPTSSAVVKSVSVVLGRSPAVTGSVAFLTVTGSTTYVMDAATVTSLRTGAVVGVATDALAPPDAAHLVLLGLGAQAPDQLRAIRVVRPIERVTLVHRDDAWVRAFRDTWAADLAGLDVEVSTDPSAAVAEADVVCCATPSTVPLFQANALPSRVHVNAIGAYRLSMRELPDELLAGALVVVDQREAALEESGEIHHAMEAGVLEERDLVELSAVLTGIERPDRTVFKSVGLAIQDWAIGAVVSGLKI